MIIEVRLIKVIKSVKVSETSPVKEKKRKKRGIIRKKTLWFTSIRKKKHWKTHEIINPEFN